MPYIAVPSVHIPLRVLACSSVLMTGTEENQARKLAGAWNLTVRLSISIFPRSGHYIGWIRTLDFQTLFLQCHMMRSKLAHVSLGPKVMPKHILVG